MSRSPSWLKRALGPFRRIAFALRWTFRVLLVLVILDLFYLAVTWPDWRKLAVGPVPKTNFMVDYEKAREADKKIPALRWQPVALVNIPKHVQRAVILAEDARFYDHSGFDLVAFKDAMSYNLSEGKFALGASTISQQTVKNLFLSSSKNPLRKWHELILTWGMEQNLSKHRILEIYLNDAELGQGIYGVQAAAQAYYGVNAADLTKEQAAELAASLPSPIKNNPATRTKPFENRTKKILNFMAVFSSPVDETTTRAPVDPTDAPADEAGVQNANAVTAPTLPLPDAI
jgi:monofunctional biosynthetic peptidoglycan transglycosylase